MSAAVLTNHGAIGSCIVFPPSQPPQKTDIDVDSQRDSVLSKISDFAIQSNSYNGHFSFTVKAKETFCVFFPVSLKFL